MRKFLFLACVAVTHLAVTVQGQERTLQKATDQQVTDGVNDSRYLTPLKLRNRLSTLTNNLAGALTNNDTRDVVFLKSLTVGTDGMTLNGTANFGLNTVNAGQGNFDGLYADSPFQANAGIQILNSTITGDGSGLTALNGSSIATGTVDPARLGSGSSISTKFLRGDSTWQTIAGGGDLLAANNLSDVANTGTSRTNLVAHDGSNLTIGTVDPARLGSGSSITTKFLRGDSTWQTIAVGGSSNLANNGNQVILTSPSGRTNFIAMDDTAAMTYPTTGHRGVELDNGGFQAFDEVDNVWVEASSNSVNFALIGTVGIQIVHDASGGAPDVLIPDLAEAGTDSFSNRRVVHALTGTGELVEAETLVSSMQLDSSTNYYITSANGGTPGSAGDFKLRDGTVQSLIVSNGASAGSEVLIGEANSRSNTIVSISGSNDLHFRAGMNTNNFGSSNGVFTVYDDAVFARSMSGNGTGLTNVLEKNVVVTTNGWGVSVVNFGLGTQLLTNMTGNLTLTGISGFVSSNLNWQTIALNPDGATRTLTVPADWWVSGGFTNGTLAAVTNGTRAKLSIEAVIGVYTNAALEHWQ